MKNNIICNCCGKEICQLSEAGEADYLYVQKEWGYFSEKDGRKQEFYLCESCYDEIIRQFQIPPKTTEITEFL